MIHFRYKNIKYTLFFYPCGYMARVTKEDSGASRDFKYDKNTTVKKFLLVLEHTTFWGDKMQVRYFIEYYNIYVGIKNTILECTKIELNNWIETFTYTGENTIKAIHKL